MVSKKNMALTVKSGDFTKVTYGTKEFEAIVIDPDGLGKGEPSVGFGFRMGEKHVGIPQSTLTDWVRESDYPVTLEPIHSNDLRVRESDYPVTLNLPSGLSFKVHEVKGSDGNNYRVIEVADWFDLADDLLDTPGRVAQSTLKKVRAFTKWFAVKGFYAEAYVGLKGAYTKQDSKATTEHQLVRQSTVATRRTLTDSIADYIVRHKRELNTNHAKWLYKHVTDDIYKSLFGKTKAQLKKELGVENIRDFMGFTDLRDLEAVESLVMRIIDKRDINPRSAVGEAFNLLMLDERILVAV